MTRPKSRVPDMPVGKRHAINRRNVTSKHIHENISENNIIIEENHVVTRFKHVAVLLFVLRRYCFTMYLHQVMQTMLSASPN